MPKIQFNENQGSTAGSDTEAAPNPTARRKSKKIKNLDLSSDLPTDDNSLEESKKGGPKIPPSKAKGARAAPPEKVNDLLLPDPGKGQSDGSLSDEEVPVVTWTPPQAGGDVWRKDAVCLDEFNFHPSLQSQLEGTTVGGCRLDGVNITVSQKISPCFATEGQKYATTDYAKEAEMTFLPTIIHPALNGHVSTFSRHREYTNYLRESGFLRLFGTAILSVYRMKTWPPEEQLMEQMLNAMGHQIPARKTVDILKKRKKEQIAKLKLLFGERCALLERLDCYESSSASVEFLDQDEILPPRSKDSPLDFAKMTEIFENMHFLGEARGGGPVDLKLHLAPTPKIPPTV